MEGASKHMMMLLELEGIKCTFNRIDTNGDKKISGAEILKVLGSNPSNQQEVDTDRDGLINSEEFIRYCVGGELFEVLREAFDRHDKDKNGLISVEEVHEMFLEFIGEICTFDDCDTMIKSVDSDRDGFVSFEELKKMICETPIEATGLLSD